MYALIFAPKVPVRVFEVTRDWDADVELADEAFDEITVNVVDSASDLRSSAMVNEDYRFIYQEATGEVAPKKFKSKAAAAERVWPLLYKVARVVADEDVAKYMHKALGSKDPAPKPKAKKTSSAPRKSKGISLDPLDLILGIRPGSRQYELASHLQHGVTIPQLKEQHGFPWTVAAIKSGMYHDLHKVKGYGIRTEFHNGESLYSRGDLAGAQVLGVEPTYDNDGQIVFADDYDENKTLPVYFLVFPDYFAEQQILLK